MNVCFQKNWAKAYMSFDLIFRSETPVKQTQENMFPNLEQKWKIHSFPPQITLPLILLSQGEFNFPGTIHYLRVFDHWPSCVWMIETQTQILKCLTLTSNTWICSFLSSFKVSDNSFYVWTIETQTQITKSLTLTFLKLESVQYLFLFENHQFILCLNGWNPNPYSEIPNTQTQIPKP